MNNNKGFTLIELMVSIAIIGILAVVIIPRVAGLKGQAKTAGIYTNLRTATAISEILLSQYNVNNIGMIENALASKLCTGNSSADMRNPVNNSTGCVDFSITAIDNNAAFGYFVDADETGDSRYDEIGQNEDFAGVILYDVYLDPDNNIRIKFVPFDDQGKPIKNAIVETTK